MTIIVTKLWLLILNYLQNSRSWIFWILFTLNTYQATYISEICWYINRNWKWLNVTGRTHVGMVGQTDVLTWSLKKLSRFHKKSFITMKNISKNHLWYHVYCTYFWILKKFKCQNIFIFAVYTVLAYLGL